jgi:hypothetical protein
MKAGRASGLDVFGGGSVEPSEDLLNMANWNFEAETNQRREQNYSRGPAKQCCQHRTCT